MARQSGQKDVINRLNDNARRIRQLEVTTRNLQEQVKSLEDQLSQHKKDINRNKSEADERMSRLSDQLENLSAEIKSVQRKTRKLVTRREFNEVREYMELMNPVESAFVTRSEVETMINDKLTEVRQR